MATKICGASRVLVKFIEGDSYYLPGMEYEETHYDGKSATFEAEGSFLVEQMIENSDNAPATPGWWMVDRLVITYYEDYDGPVDADYEVSSWRPAVQADLDHFGVGENV